MAGQTTFGMGAPAVTERLVAYIEQHYEEGGSSHNGVRVVVIPESIGAIGFRFGVSGGTVRAALVYLERIGYIIGRQPGLYLRLAPVFLTPSEGDDEDWDEETHDALVRRLDEETVRDIVRSLLRERGQRDAMLFIRAHRQWSWRNGLTPYL